MFSRVLVPLDGSNFSLGALPAAAGLARIAPGEIRLVSVLERSPESTGSFADGDRGWAENHLEAASKYLRGFWGGGLTTAVVEGRASEAIIAEANRYEADVIVLATHGRGGLSRAWLGSVADQCMRMSHRPVLAVRPSESDGAPRPLAAARVVVPLDGSELAEAAIPYGATLATALGVPLSLLRSFPGPWVEDTHHLAETIDRSKAAAEYLNQHAERLIEEGVRTKQIVVVDSGATHAILSEADGDLVVMSTHGRGGAGRVIFGSVTDKVVRGTSGAVLVIPPGAKPAAVAV